MKSNKEDPEDARARQVERRQSLLERRQAAEKNAGGLTNDLRAVYGLQSLFNFGQAGSYRTPTAQPRSALAPEPRKDLRGNILYPGR